MTTNFFLSNDKLALLFFVNPSYQVKQRKLLPGWLQNVKEVNQPSFK